MTANVPVVFGRIEQVSARKITGWLYCPTRTVVPKVSVDGHFVRVVKVGESRPDVSRELGGSGKFGWVAEPDSLRVGSRIRLYAQAGDAMYLVREKLSLAEKYQHGFWSAFEEARRIAKLQDSVAITCWDIAHNPLGRAKVLVDAISKERPTVLFGYMNADFGTALWQPLRNAPIHVVPIPWDRREEIGSLIRDAALEFKTVWICKPRLPNFELAATLAARDAKLILDLDDNEEYFSSSEASRSKIYGGGGLSLARLFTNRVSARTVASRSLESEYGGELLRHVRRPAGASALAQAADSNPPSVEVETCEPPSPETAGLSSEAVMDERRNKKVVGFIGTVRPHKNLLAAARVIRAAKWAAGLDVEFRVLGDVRPEQLVKDLQNAGAVVSGVVPADRLSQEVAELDVVLTGFPSSNVDHSEANRYQITSKIGDALAVGKPVLVPRTSAVEDLGEVPGIYLFDEDDFCDQLTKAVAGGSGFVLPKEFLPEAGFEAFNRAERAAAASPRAGEVLAELFDDSGSRTPALDLALDRPVVLLLRKHHDAGLYGRRVDQVARAIRRESPGVEVRVLEILHDADRDRYEKGKSNFFADSSAILSLADAKARGLIDPDGVIYDQISIRAFAHAGVALESYLIRNRITPKNSILGIFPEIRGFDEIRSVLAPYRRFVDVVDNQLGWASPDSARRSQIVGQYYELSHDSDLVIFGSARNFEFFGENGLISDRANVLVASNWYLEQGQVELSGVPEVSPSDLQFNVFYSGNMNDRVDWSTLRAVPTLGSDVRLHLVGSATRSIGELSETLKDPAITYYGPRSEAFVCRLLRKMNVAVIPHRSNGVSAYMNPLKLHMYSSLGVDTVAVDIPGLDHGVKGLEVVGNGFEMLQALARRRQAVGDEGCSDSVFVVRGEVPERAKEYVRRILRLMP